MSSIQYSYTVDGRFIQYKNENKMGGVEHFMVRGGRNFIRSLGNTNTNAAPKTTAKPHVLTIAAANAIANQKLTAAQQAIAAQKALKSPAKSLANR